jgi:hypothetical protein
MPNWCLNKLTVLGSREDVQAFRDKAKGQSPWPQPKEAEQAAENPLNFHSLVPVPEQVLKSGYESAGHLWETEHWGCKWGAAETAIVDECDGLIVYDFHTAWSPPIELLETTAKLFPALTFLLDYDEPGMAFKGIAKFKGEASEDHCIHY